jgi:RNA-directed DNA polymerase
MSKKGRSNRKSILDLSHDKARDFFLKSESYFSLDLPSYLEFSSLIKDTAKALHGKKLADLMDGGTVKDHDDVNYTILNNKDGRYAWRPFQLIHPALYVSLVNELTSEPNWKVVRERFKAFAANDKILCLSLPITSTARRSSRAEQITHWWETVEQTAIELALEYEHVLETDITDCYGAIYTHSIVWALHGKAEAKKKENRKNRNLIGVVIDIHVQDMRHGQTNGIPQGSALMDFIAEMVLGYADLELSERLGKEGVVDYQILRYRDDYRVFANDQREADAIAKAITEILSGLGLKLNPSKTRATSEVVRASIKSDKLSWIARKQEERDFQKHLLILHDHANGFPNSGSLARALSDYHKRLLRAKRKPQDVMPLIAIVVDIAYRNPRTYSMAVAILSILLGQLDSERTKTQALKSILKKFKRLPNTGHMEIWLQRASLPISKDIKFDEAICKLVADETVALWNNDWITSSDLKKAVDPSKVVKKAKRDKLKPTIQAGEVDLFAY